jgi:hypothetical protein
VVKVLRYPAPAVYWMDVSDKDIHKKKNKESQMVQTKKYNKNTSFI